MIEKSTIHIESRDSKVPTCTLAPFGPAEVAQYLPIPEQSLKYELSALRRSYAEGNLDEIMQTMQNSTRCRYWGIYTGRPSTRTFIGVRGMGNARANNGQTRSVSGLIMPEKSRGKDYGRAALLGLAALAFHQKSAGLLAGLSEHNKASQGGVRAVGFTHLHTTRHYAFMGGERSQFWGLFPATDEGRRAIASFGAARTVDLTPGWEKYLEQRAKARIKLNGKLLKIS